VARDRPFRACGRSPHRPRPFRAKVHVPSAPAGKRAGLRGGAAHPPTERALIKVPKNCARNGYFRRRNHRISW
ncbi:hypothetical protein EXE43_20080, partial [Halorubrum sp. SS5]